MPHILLVEDEPGLVLTLTDLLTNAGHDIESARDGEEGSARARGGNFDLIVLDLMLPRKQGFEICAELRSSGNTTPVLMLTARGQTADRVAGLRIGADDYMPKPFDPEELLARVEALLRRASRGTAGHTHRIRFGRVEADFDRAEVRRDGEPIALAALEYALLAYLIQHRDRMITREEILRNVWKYSPDVSSRTVDVHVALLRQKLEETPQTPAHIVTVRGRGYRFNL